MQTRTCGAGEKAKLLKARPTTKTIREATAHMTATGVSLSLCKKSLDLRNRGRPLPPRGVVGKAEVRWERPPVSNQRKTGGRGSQGQVGGEKKRDRGERRLREERGGKWGERERKGRSLRAASHCYDAICQDC